MKKKKENIRKMNEKQEYRLKVELNEWNEKRRRKNPEKCNENNQNMNEREN